MPPAALRLVIPGLDWTAQALRDLSFDLSLPGINALIDSGRLAVEPCHDDPLLGFLTGANTVPVAACRLLGLGQVPGQSRWLCLDPVHLAVNERGIIVSDPARLMLSAAEARSIAVALASTLGELGRLEVATPSCWHLELHPGAPEPQLPPLPEVIGHNGRTGLARDKTWRRILNEAQIMLHDHPVNQQRATNGQVTVNSLWPWGTGQLPPSTRPLEGVDVFSADPVTVGLARHLGGNVAPAPADWANVAAAHSSVFVLETLVEPARRQDAMAWRAAISELDARWLAPLAEAWHTGQATTIELILPALGKPRRLRLSANTILARFARRLLGNRLNHSQQGLARLAIAEETHA